MESDQNRKLLQAAPALISAIAAILLYAITLGGGYVYDDVQVVRDDPRLHQTSQWSRFWTTDYFDGGVDNLYRPLVSTSYAVQWWLHGDRPWIFHGVNILLHALAAAGVAELTRRVLKQITPALIAGLFFAVHPVHVEAVANIVGRAELACTAAILWGLVILCRQPMTLQRVLGIIGIGIVGLLCKEQGILQPLLWLFFGYLVVRPRPPTAAKILLLLSCWIWAGYLIGREHFLKFDWDRSYMDPTIQPLIRSIGIDRILMPIVLLGHYIALMVWPLHLSPDYGADVIGSVAHRGDPYLWIGFFSIAAWLGIAAWSYNQSRYFVLFCLLSFAATYGVIGNILTLIGTNFAERLIYLPSAFLLILASQWITRISTRSRTTLVALLILLGSIRSFSAARQWNKPVVLFQNALATHPKSIQLHLLLAQTYHDQGNCPAAIQLLKEVCDVYPRYWRVWVYRALEEMNDGNFADAEKHLQLALKLQAHPRELAAFSRLEELKSSHQNHPPASANQQSTGKMLPPG